MTTARHGPAVRSALIGFALLSGCVMEVPGEEPAPLDEVAMLADNGIFLDNGLKLTNGADPGNGIKLTNGFDLSNGLDLANGIKLTNGESTIEPPPGSDLEEWLDVDPTMRLRIIRYQVECALAAGAAITVIYQGQSFRFEGQIGLGTGWQAGAMTVTEQERVSACLLARVNARGNSLRVNLVGPYPRLDRLTEEEFALYPYREATFVGNLFLDAPWAHVADLGCGSRACRVNLEASSCECGLLSTGTAMCSGTGDTAYDTYCRTSLDDQEHGNPITTFVVQAPPGGACTTDSDCMSWNCSSGVCGGVGAACAWTTMCAPTVECAEDHRCGGRDATCTRDFQCWGGHCGGGTCR